MPLKDNSNGRNDPKASDVKQGTAPHGTAGRKTWPTLSK
jgi:hypothetical protein